MAKIRSRLGRVFGRVWEFWHDFKKWRRDIEEASKYFLSYWKSGSVNCYRLCKGCVYKGSTTINGRQIQLVDTGLRRPIQAIMRWFFLEYH